MDAVAHPFHKLVYVASGTGTLIGHGNRALEAGAAVIIPADTDHCFIDRVREPLCLLGLCVDQRTIADNPLIASAWKDLGRRLPPLIPRSIRDAYHTTQVDRRMRAMIFEQTRSRRGVGVSLWGQCLELLNACDRALSATPAQRTSDPHSAFAATITWLEHHFHQPVSVPELAARAQLSYRGYTMRFRATTGSSVLAHLDRLRIDHACRLLRSGTAIIDTAFSSGFADLSHFYRHFKRRTGVTPAQWAASNR